MDSDETAVAIAVSDEGVEDLVPAVKRPLRMIDLNFKPPFAAVSISNTVNETRRHGWEWG